MSSSATSVKVQMPQMGISVSEGTILEWRKAVGDQVSADEPIAEGLSDAERSAALEDEDLGVAHQVPVPAQATFWALTLAANRSTKNLSSGAIVEPPEMMNTTPRHASRPPSATRRRR